MRTITCLLHGRPELLGPQLDALLACQELGRFGRLILSVDPGHKNTDWLRYIVQDVVAAINQAGVIRTELVVANAKLGVAEHPRTAMARAFGEFGASLAVSLEDDALPKPDLLRMALWYEQEANHEAALMSFCNHRDFGRGAQDQIPEDEPSYMAESVHISSPFAWATVPEHWHWMSQGWNFKKAPPLGWDWSLSMLMRMGRKVGLHPILSRCQNVGREGGTHESAESFDRTQLGLLYQEVPYHGPYELVARMDRADLELTDAWMQPEIWKMHGHMPPSYFCMGCYKVREECVCQDSRL